MPSYQENITPIARCDHIADWWWLSCFELYWLYPAGTQKSGYPHIPVISLNLSGLESNPGFQITLPLAMKGIYAVVLGDVFMKCLYRVRPYEAVPGSANALHENGERSVKNFYLVVIHPGELSHRCAHRSYMNLTNFRFSIEKNRVLES